MHGPAAEWQNTLLDTHQLCTHRTRPALEWARSRNQAKSSVIIVFPPPRGYIATMRARGRPNTRGMDRDGHRGFETSMRPRVAHGVRRSGAPRRSRSQQPVLEATPPPAPIHGGDRDTTSFDQFFRPNLVVFRAGKGLPVLWKGSRSQRLFYACTSICVLASSN